MPNNYILLDRIELNDTAASVTFDNIPQSGYTDLKIVISARSTAGSEDISLLSINGSTTNFSARYLQGNGASASSSSIARWGGNYTASNNTANTFGNAELYFPNYRSSNFKSYSVDNVTETNGTTAYAGIVAGLWSNTAAITSITFTPNSGSYVAGCTFSLYGLAQVGTTPAIAPKADGGNVIGTDGTYWYHAFLSNGTFTPQVGLTADVLVVAGGGGGGTNGGGGGAGGLLAFTSQSLTATNYTCTIGAGGVGVAGSYPAGTSGINSQFASLTAAVGGGGGGGANNAPLSGGSGGGGGWGLGAYSGAAGTSGQGNAGGSYTTGNPAGGGGGSGAAGVNGSSGGTGGAGLNTYSAWATATSTGVSGRYAAGGGGGGSGTSAGAGGAGGGGAGSNNNIIATAGTINTGSGGGGGGSGAGVGGAGGSGIVIIRYLVA